MNAAVDEDSAPPALMPGDPVAALRPVKDPHELRDRTIRDYTRSMGAPGMPSTAEGIERLALADLALGDAYNRDAPTGFAPTAEQRAAAKAERDAAQASEMRARGIELTRSKPRDLGPQLDIPPSIGLSDRWMHAKGRLSAILRGAGPPRRFPSGAFDFRSMTSTCECPDLAYRFLAAWFDFDLRHVPETARHNPFYGMAHRDASLKLVRVVEDLCDKSTGRLGPWWVPK